MEEIKNQGSLLSAELSDVLSKNPFNGPVDEDMEEWKPIVEKMISHYDRILEKSGDKVYLPEGTILYHGSMEYPFLGGTPDTETKTFFGLDIEISIWYISEIIDGYLSQRSLSEPIHKYGFLYSFRLKQKLEITSILNQLHQHPSETQECQAKTNVCLHPQIAYRGDVEYAPEIYRLSSEITLFFDTHKDNLEFIRFYVVDPLKLHAEKENVDFKSRDAIIRRYNKPPAVVDESYLEKVNIKYFRKAYFGSLKKKKKKKKKKRTKRKSKKKKTI